MTLLRAGLVRLEAFLRGWTSSRIAQKGYATPAWGMAPASEGPWIPVDPWSYCLDGTTNVAS